LNGREYDRIIEKGGGGGEVLVFCRNIIEGELGVALQGGRGRGGEEVVVGENMKTNGWRAL